MHVLGIQCLLSESSVGWNMVKGLGSLSTFSVLGAVQGSGWWGVGCSQTRSGTGIIGGPSRKSSSVVKGAVAGLMIFFSKIKLT